MVRNTCEIDTKRRRNVKLANADRSKDSMDAPDNGREDANDIAAAIEDAGSTRAGAGKYATDMKDEEILNNQREELRERLCVCVRTDEKSSGDCLSLVMLM
jgi:hypothetical protein